MAHGWPPTVIRRKRMKKKTSKYQIQVGSEITGQTKKKRMSSTKKERGGYKERRTNRKPQKTTKWLNAAKGGGGQVTKN